MIVEAPAGAEGGRLLGALHAAATDEPWPAESFTALLDGPGVAARLALEGGEPAGFVLLRTAADEAEILMVATARDARRRGLGRALMQVALDQARQAGAVRMLLEVAADNAAARALYQSLGFERAGLRRGYYGRGEGVVDALVLALDLRP